MLGEGSIQSEAELLARRASTAIERAQALRASVAGLSELGFAAYRSALASERQSLLDKQRVLLAEVHHRVRNNLQQTSSLLHMQAAARASAAERAQLLAAERRILVLAHVDECVYDTQDFSSVEFGACLKRLAGFLLRTCGAVDRVELDVDAQPAEVSREQAASLALVANEAIANAILHAFPEGGRGTVQVTFGTRDGLLILTVADDGVGLPRGFDCRKGGGFGTKIMSGLTAQLGGSLECSSAERGSRVTVTVPQAPPTSRRMVLGGRQNT